MSIKVSLNLIHRKPQYMRISTFLVVLAGLLNMSCHTKDSPSLTIAVAANMQFAMEALTAAFTNETGIACETVTSSSGKLTAQIIGGAPIDLFVSADMKYPNTLFESGVTVEPPKVYAYGKLVLFTMVDNIDPTMEMLKEDDIRHIAIGNPKTAPYGRAAVEVLQHYKLYETLEDKLVYGESIGQANQFITTEAAELGLTAKSLVMAPKMRGKGKWIEIDTDIYSPIAQGVVILNNRSTNSEEAEAFYKFLFSEQGKEILVNFGYSTPDE